MTRRDPKRRRGPHQSDGKFAENGTSRPLRPDPVEQHLVRRPHVQDVRRDHRETVVETICVSESVVSANEAYLNEFGPVGMVVKPRKDFGAVELDMAFAVAKRKAPSMLVLEDLDSFTRETQVTRAGLLAQLDGIGSSEGILVLGTTNHPEDVDPALIHRPSRFDRVWRFGLPGAELRRRYLGQAFPALEPDRLERMGGETEGWSFAYLNELRTTAILLSLGSGSDAPGANDIEKAHGLLAAQFRAGRKNHAGEDEPAVGFMVA